MNMNKNKSHEGGTAYAQTGKEEIYELFSLGLLHGTFYQSPEEIEAKAHEVFKNALVSYPEYATECAINGVQKHGLKTVPLLWLIYLSTLEDKQLFKESFSSIVKTPSTLHFLLEYSRKGNIRSGVGRTLKSVANQWLQENLNEYWACRYRTKLKEIIRITRPKSSSLTNVQFTKYLDYLQNGTLSFDRVKILKEVLSEIGANKVTEETLTNIEQQQLQLEELKHQFGHLTQENKRKVYLSIFKGLSYAALIQNLAGLESVFKEDGVVILTKLECLAIGERIENIEAYKKSNMLPFTLISAYYMIESPILKRSIEKALIQISEDGVEPSEVPYMIVLDASSSMNFTNLTKSLSTMNVASIYAALIQKRNPNTKLYAVASNRREIEQEDSIFKTAKTISEISLGMGTLLGQIMEEYQGGNLLILTDSETGNDSETGDDLEKTWLEKGKGKGKLIIWQMTNSNLRVSNDSSVIYLQGYKEETWRQLHSIINTEGNGE